MFQLRNLLSSILTSISPKVGMTSLKLQLDRHCLVFGQLVKKICIFGESRYKLKAKVEYRRVGLKIKLDMKHIELGKEII